MPTSRDTLGNFSAIIITGGSSGIGKSFIELIGNLCPATLICNLSRRKPGLTIAQLNLRHFECDLANSAAIAAVVPQLLALVATEAPAGRVLLINNSGFGDFGPFPGSGLAAQRGMIDVNIRAVIDLTGQLLPLLRARGGVILTVASTAAYQPTPGLATYGATKAFVLNWSVALGEELRGSGVTTLALCPGPTVTDFFQRAGLPDDSLALAHGQTCDQVVRTAVGALGSGRRVVVSGWLNWLGAFFGARLPKTWVARLAALALARYRRPPASP